MMAKINKGEVKVAFRLQANMLGDSFTKTQQGSLFVWIQERILNLPASISTSLHRSVLEDCKNNEEKITEASCLELSQSIDGPVRSSSQVCLLVLVCSRTLHLE